MKILTLTRISPRNIYLNFFGGAHFKWRSLKARNIVKRTCLNYVWTAIFPWSYFSLKLQILRLFRARSSKTVEVESLWNTRSSYRSCSVRKDVLRNFPKFTGKYICQSLFFKKETVAQVFSCEFCEISKNAFLQNTSWRLLLQRAWHNNNIQLFL